MEYSENRPTKFAYLGVGQAVPSEEISGFAVDLFPNHTQNVPLVLIQAQATAVQVYTHAPDYDFTTDLFHSDSSSFQRTDFVQLGTLELCAASVEAANLQLDGKPIVPDFFAGHSLGSIFAAYLAGVIPTRKQLREIGAFRGRVMQEAYEETHTTLVNLQGLSEEAVIDILPEYAKIGLINAPTLIAVGLPEYRIEEFQEIAKKAGARRMTLLGTKGAFHVAMYMGKAAEQMGKFLKPYDFADITIGAFVTNSDGKILTRGAQIKEELVSSMLVPVRYPDMLQTMTAVDKFIEIGPGKVLSALNNSNRISRSRTSHIRDYLR